MTRNLTTVGPNLIKIIERLESNQNLMKLLYYTGKDPLNEEDLTSAQIKSEIYEKLLKVVPKISALETSNSIVALLITGGYPEMANTEFIDLQLKISVYTPLTQWFIKDTNLRPFCIMGEIIKSLDGKNVDGLGRITDNGFVIDYITEEISCYTLEFKITTYGK